MDDQRGVEVYSNQFATWRDGCFVANNNLKRVDFGYCQAQRVTLVKVGIISNYYIAEAMDSSNN